MGLPTTEHDPYDDRPSKVLMDFFDTKILSSSFYLGTVKLYIVLANNGKRILHDETVKYVSPFGFYSAKHTININLLYD